MNNLRAEGKISGKMLGSDKDIWVLWHKQQPSKTELRERDMPNLMFQAVNRSNGFC
jgi:hypothetical protein